MTTTVLLCPCCGILVEAIYIEHLNENDSRMECPKPGCGWRWVERYMR